MSQTPPSPELVVSVDASCSGRKAACAAVGMAGERPVAERSRWLGEVDGYVLAAEIGAVALASDLIADEGLKPPIVIEVDNPEVPRVLLEGAAPRQAGRIPHHLLAKAAALVRTPGVTVRLLPRNSTPGLRRADRLAGKRLWGR